MKKTIKNIIITILFIAVIIFFPYVKYYYGKINSIYILTHFVVCFNIVFNIIGDLYSKITDSMFTTDNIKVIVIGSIIIYITRHMDLKDFLKEFLKYTNKFESPWFSFERQLAVLNDISIDEGKTIANLNSMSSSKDNDGEDVEKKIDLSKKKMRLIQIITSDHYLLQLLNNFIDKKNFKKKIPVNVFKTYNTDKFKEIFNITYENGYVILNGIKDDIRDVVNEIYLDISTRY